MEKVTGGELLQAIKTLALLARRGYSLDQAVKAIDQESGPWLRVSEHLSGGDTLGQALDRYPQIFSPFFRGILQSAEKSENSVSILETLSKWLETSELVRSRIRGLLRYPVLLLSFLLIECGILFTYGLPEVILPMLHVPSNAEVPQWQVSLSLLLGTICLLGGLGGFLASVRVEHLLPAARMFPAFQRAVVRSDLALWARAVAAYLQAGKTLPEALDGSWSIAWSRSLKDELKGLGERVRSGDSLSQALSRLELVDPQISWAVTAGENKEDLSATLLYGAGRLEHGLEQSCHAFLVFLQPTAVVLIGLLTALVLAPFWWSIYALSENLAH